MSRFSEWFDKLVADAGCTEDGRMFEAAGFELEHTGGGCTARRRSAVDGYYILITDSTGTDHRLSDRYATDSGQPDCWLIGLHLVDGDHLDGSEAATVSEAIQAARQLDITACQFGIPDD